MRLNIQQLRVLRALADGHQLRLARRSGWELVHDGEVQSVAAGTFYSLFDVLHLIETGETGYRLTEAGRKVLDWYEDTTLFQPLEE